MKRFLLLAAMLFAPASCWSQNTFVTATVLDPASRPYTFATGYAALVCPGNQQPTYNGFTVPRTFSITGFDGTGTFTQTLYDTGVILPIGCGYSWHITWSDGVTTFITGTITSVTGSSVNESAAISAFAVLLPPSAGAVASIFATAPIVATPNPILSTGTISCPTCFTGAIANTQIAVGTGASIAGSANFTWNGSILFVNNPTLATAILNQNSPQVCMQGNVWNGASSVTDQFCFQDVLTTGASVLQVIHSGGASPGMSSMMLPGAINLGAAGTGIAGSAITMYGVNDGQLAIGTGPHAGNPHLLVPPGIDPTATGQYMFVVAAPGSSTNLGYFTAFSECGTVAAGGACSNAVGTSPHCLGGIATLSGGTSTITGLLPAFTSASTFFVITNDITTIANPSKGVPASGTTITFTGTSTDNIQFIACGG